MNWNGTIANSRLTFFGASPCTWKCGANTVRATSSSPFSVALPIRVMGVSRWTQRLRLSPDDSVASTQIRWTNETGSMGSRVLKKITTVVTTLLDIRALHVVIKSDGKREEVRSYRIEHQS